MDYYARIGKIIGVEKPDIVRLRIRPVLKRHKLPENWDGLISLVGIGGDPEKWEMDLGEDSANFRYTGNKKTPTSFKEAMAFFQVDTLKWKPVKLSHKSWDVHMKRKAYVDDNGKEVFKGGRMIDLVECRTNNYIELKCDPVENDPVEIAINALKDYKPKPFYFKPSMNDQPVVAVVSDIHAGAKYTGGHITPPYDISVLERRFHEFINVVCGFHRPVRVMFLGDAIETMTGLNHPDSWKYIEAHGSVAIISAFEIISQVGAIPYLETFDIVSGNHDRITSSSKEDREGQAAGLLAYMLKMKFPELGITFDHTVISKNYEGIQYILAHGDKAFINRPNSDIVLKYGDKDRYNVILHGHLHTRRKYPPEWEESKYCRRYSVPALFSGNNFSEEHGFSSPPGFMVIEPGRAGVNVHDFTIM